MRRYRRARRSAPQRRKRATGFWYGLFHPFARARQRRLAREHADFAADLLGLLDETARAGCYEYDAATFALHETESGRVFPLDVPFQRALRTTPEELEQVLHEIRRELLVPPIPLNLDQALGRLVFELRCRAAHETARLAGDTSLPVVVQISDTLVAALMYVGSSARHPCSEEVVAGWGYAPEEVIQAALDSRRRRKAARRILQPGPDGLLISSNREGIGFAMLCMKDTLRGTSLQGEAVVMAPDAGTLIVADSASDASVAAMVRLASHWVGRGLSGTALRWTGDQFKRYEPEDGSVAAELRALEIGFELRAFDRQHRLLTALHAGGDSKRQVVRAERDTGSYPRTICRWERPGDALLPVTDRIALPPLRDQGEPGPVMEWAEAMAKLGDRVESTDLWPPRVRVRGLPSVDVLRSLDPSLG